MADTCTDAPPIRTTVCDCGHTALAHHGLDGRTAPDAGCMALPMLLPGWCECPKTASQVAEAVRDA